LLRRWAVPVEAIAFDPERGRLSASFVPKPYVAADDLPGLVP
jgi:hypothetical protein